MHCRKAGTLTEPFSLKHPPSANVTLGVFFKKEKKNQLSFTSDLFKKSFLKNIKSIVEYNNSYFCADKTTGWLQPFVFLPVLR